MLQVSITKYLLVLLNTPLGSKQGHAENFGMMHPCAAGLRLQPLMNCAAAAGDVLCSLHCCCTVRWQQQLQSGEAWVPAATGMESLHR